MNKELKAIQSALRRLDRSSTCLTRRNATREFSAAMRDLARAVKSKYPTIREDGSVIAPRRKRGTVCPICRVPMQSFASLARHILANHATHMRPIHAPSTWPHDGKARWAGLNVSIPGQVRCACGRDCHTVTRADSRASALKSFTRHLAGVPDIREHFGIAALTAGIKI